MKTYSTVEDYLEVIAGIRDPVTLKTKPNNWFNDFEPIVNLARYDTDVLNSMSTTANEGRALTEKQGALAVKIVIKYKRQLAAKGIDVAPVEEQVTWRMPLRKLDYTRKIALHDDKIMVQFPFDSVLIDSLRDFRKESQGHGEWNKENKTWSFALTEYNLVWLTTWAQQNNFEIDQELAQLNSIVAKVEKTPYAIELELANGELTISNCPVTLHEYIVSHMGGFDIDNMMRLVDMSAVLGYTVSTTIADLIVANTTPRFYNLAISREVKLNPIGNAQDLASVLDYADTMQRWPVVIYEPDLSGKLLAQMRGLREGVVEVPRTVKLRNWDAGFRYVHVVTPVVDQKIPLLISSAGMMFGGDKSLMVQNAEKIVYCAAEVYNKKVETKVEKLADL
jgi:hypothetical protein